MSIAKKVRRKWNRFRDRRRKYIRAVAKRHPDAAVRCRAQIIIALVQEKPVSDIVAILQCSRSLVYKVAKKFGQLGEAAFADRREDNGDRVVNKTVEDAICALVSETPRQFKESRTSWTLELLVKVLRKRMGIRLSRTTMFRVLRRLKIRLGSPKPFVHCPWAKDRKELRIKRLRYLLLHVRDGEVWFFEDEVDIHLNPKIGRDYMLRGQQKRVLTPGVNVKRYLAGALNAHTGKLTWVEGNSKNSELFMSLIFALGREYDGAKRLHLIVDNYSIHKSQFTKLVLASCMGKVRLHFLPPYCPDDNRIERVWLDLHANVTRNHDCPTMRDLMVEVRRWLRKESKRLQRKYAQQDPQEVYAIAV